MPEALLIFGSSGHGLVVADAARAAGWELAGWADDDDGRRACSIDDAPVVAIGVSEAIAYAAGHDCAAVVAIGDNRVRKRVYEALVGGGLRIATIVHPSAVLAPSVRVGQGTVVFAGCVVNPAATVGENVIVNTSASIDHDNNIGDHAHISPGARLGGTVVVGQGTHIGIGAIVRNNLQIGSWSVIGAGAVVVADVDAGVVSYGVPSRVIRRNDQ